MSDFSTPFRVGEFLVDPATRELRWVGGDAGAGVGTAEVEPQRLGHKPLSLLQSLARRRGGVVTKVELIDEVWDGDVTTDDAVMAVVYELRKALGDDARSPRYVETIRQRGYRLVADVEPLVEPLVEPVAVWLAENSAGDGRTPGAGRWLIVAALVVAVVVVAALWTHRDRSATSDEAGADPEEIQQVVEVPEIHSLAIRPLAAFGEQCMEDPFVDSLTELLIAELVDGPPLEILGAVEGQIWPTEPTADAVLEGSIIRSGDGIWVNVRLVESSTGRLVWGASYERQAVNLLLERALAAQIAVDLLEVVE